jgi:hypothetical protein
VAGDGIEALADTEDVVCPSSFRRHVVLDHGTMMTSVLKVNSKVFLKLQDGKAY